VNISNKEVPTTTIEKIHKEEYQKVHNTFADISIDNISVLVRHNDGKYVVFLDQASELDWETTNAFEEENAVNSEERDKILAEIEWLQHQPCVKIISKERQVCFNLLLAECWCYALDDFFEIANTHLRRAEQYLNDRKVETSRKWQLFSCLSIVGVFAIAVITINRCFFVSATFTDWSNYLLFGALGTALSLIINSSVRTYNCESGKLLNFLEVLSRLIASLLSCIVIILMFDLNIIFTALKDNHAPEALRLLCVIAGFSERLIPSILRKMENDEIKENKQ
jgi:L-rhamnose mutarotase